MPKSQASLLRGTWPSYASRAADAQGRDSLLPAKVVPAVVVGTAVLAAALLVLLRRRAPVGGLHSACCISADTEPADAAAKRDQVAVQVGENQV